MASGQQDSVGSEINAIEKIVVDVRLLLLTYSSDKEMEHKAVKKKWDSWISKNLANLQGNVRNKSFLDF